MKIIAGVFRSINSTFSRKGEELTLLAAFGVLIRRGGDFFYLGGWGRWSYLSFFSSDVDARIWEKSGSSGV